MIDADAPLAEPSHAEPSGAASQGPHAEIPPLVPADAGTQPLPHLEAEASGKVGIPASSGMSASGDASIPFQDVLLSQSPLSIRLRFVSGRDAVSLAIRARENFPFSHAEAVTPQGRYLGAHANGGVAARVPGYDAAWLERDLFVDLPAAAPAQAEAFYAFLARHIGEPYDFESILGFLLPGVALHEARHVICSALVTLALRQCGWFAAPLCEPAHKISPRDLLLMISARIPVEM